MSRFVLTAQLQLQAPNNVAQVVSQIQNQLNNVSVSVQVQGAAQAQRQIQQITQSTNGAATAAERMGRAFAVSVRRFAAFSIATRAVGLFTSTLSDAVQTAISFERELIKISQVTGKNVSKLRDLTDEITRLSTSFGVSSNDLLQVTTVLAQAGLSANDTKIALDSLAKAALAPNFDSIQETAEGAIAILAQFKEGVGALESQLGSIDAVAGAFAVEAGDLIDVIRRAGGVFKSSGGSLNELLALFTSVRATTRESAESIGTGLRTIFTRIQRPQTIEFLKQFGVELVDLEGKFVGPFEAVRRLSSALAGLGERDITFIRIAEELGGFRQIGKVLPLLQQFSTAQAALNVAQEGGIGLTKNAESAQAALAIRIAKVNEEFLALIRSITETSTFQIFANTALNLASALIKVADSVKPLLPLLGALAAFKIARGFGTFLGGISGGLSSTRTFNKGGKVLAFAQGGLVPGSGNEDNVEAVLTPGEFVLKKAAVKRIGASNLRAMNQNRMQFGGRPTGAEISRQLPPSGRSVVAGKSYKAGEFGEISLLENLSEEVESKLGADRALYGAVFLEPLAQAQLLQGKLDKNLIQKKIQSSNSYKSLQAFAKKDEQASNLLSNEVQKIVADSNKPSAGFDVSIGSLDNDTATKMKNFILQQVSDAVQTSAEMINSQIGVKGAADQANILKSSGIEATVGNIFEAAVTSASNADPFFGRDASADFDYPLGIGNNIGSKFAIAARAYDRPSDAKNYLNQDNIKSLNKKVTNFETENAIQLIDREILEKLGEVKSKNISESYSLQKSYIKSGLRRHFGGIIQKLAAGGRPDPKNSLESYFADSSSINLGLANSKSLSKNQRKALASDVRNLRQLRTPAPSVLYSSISRVAFDRFASQVGFNKNPPIPEGTKYFDQEKYLSLEANKLAGKSFKLPGFVSTSKDFTQAKSFLDNAPRSEDKWAAMFTITTKPNAQGVDVAQQLSGRNINITKQAINPRNGKMETMYMNPPSKEQEVMLQPRSRFRINDARAVRLGIHKNLWANVQQFAAGGIVPGVGNGDTVPAVLQEGSFVIRKSSVKKIGAENLASMAGYAAGGAAKKRVPALLTPGEFVFDSTSATNIGYGTLNRMNKLGKYNKGGAVQRFQVGGMPDASRSYGAGFVGSGGLDSGQSFIPSNLLTQQAKSLAQLTQATNNTTDSQKKQKRSINEVVQSNKFFALSMATSLAQGFLPAVDDSSSALIKLSHGMLGLVTTITSVGFALEAFSIQLKTSSILQFLSGGGFNIEGTSKLFNTLTGQMGDFGRVFRATTQAALRGSAAQGIAAGATSATRAGISGTLSAKAASSLGLFTANIAPAIQALSKFAGPLIAVTAGLSALNIVINSFFDRTAEINKAIESGDVQAAGRAARGQSNLENANNARMGLGIAGAIGGGLGAAQLGAILGTTIGPGLGTAIGAALGATIGTLGSALTEKIGILFGGNTLASTVALAEAQAQSVKTSKAFEQGEKDATKALKELQDGTISAEEALRRIAPVAQEAANFQSKSNEAIRKNVENRSGTLARAGRYLAATATLGYVDTGAERDQKINDQNKETAKDNLEKQRRAFDIQRDIRNERIRSSIVKGESESEAVGGDILDLERQQTKFQNIANSYRAEGDAATATIFEEQAKLAGEQAKELKESFTNLSKEVELARKKFEAINLGFRSVTANSEAAALRLNNFVANLEVGAVPAQQAVATLEASITQAGQAISANEVNSALDEVSGVFAQFGATEAEISKFRENLSAVATVQRSFPTIFENMRNQIKAGGFRGMSSENIGKMFKDQVSAQLESSGVGEEVRKRILESMGDVKIGPEIIAAIDRGDYSALDVYLKDAGEEAQKVMKEIVDNYAKIHQQLIDLTKRRIEAERNYIEAQKEALSIAMEARELQGKYGSEPVTNAERRANVLARANVGVGRPGVQLNNLQTGRPDELIARNNQIRQRFATLETGRRVEGGMAGVQGVKDDAAQADLERAAKDQVSTIRELIKIQEDELKIIQEKNRLEKESLDALISGDVDKFFEQQAAVGATAAIATGNQSVMNAFGAQALGAAYADIQKQQEAGVQELYGVKLGGQGGLAEQAAQAALSARGVQDPRLAQIAARTTAEEEGIRNNINSLADALRDAGQVQADLAAMRLETANINVQQAEIRLANGDAFKVGGPSAPPIGGGGGNGSGGPGGASGAATDAAATSAAGSTSKASATGTSGVGGAGGAAAGISGINNMATNGSAQNNTPSTNRRRFVGLSDLPRYGGGLGLIASGISDVATSTSGKFNAGRDIYTISRNSNRIGGNNLKPNSLTGKLGYGFEKTSRNIQIAASRFSNGRILQQAGITPDSLIGKAGALFERSRSSIPSRLQSLKNTVSSYVPQRLTQFGNNISQQYGYFQAGRELQRQGLSTSTRAGRAGALVESGVQRLSGTGRSIQGFAQPYITRASNAFSNFRTGLSRTNAPTFGSRAMSAGQTVGGIFNSLKTGVSNAGQYLASSNAGQFVSNKLLPRLAPLASGAGKVALKTLGPAGSIADVAMGAYSGAKADANVRAARDEKGNIIGPGLVSDKVLDKQSTVEKAIVGALTGSATVGGSVSGGLLGLEQGSATDVGLGGFESVLRGAAIGGTFGGAPGAVVGAAVGGGAELYKGARQYSIEQAAANEAVAKTESMKAATVDSTGLDVLERNWAREQAMRENELEDAQSRGDQAGIQKAQKELKDLSSSMIRERTSNNWLPNWLNITGSGSGTDPVGFKEEVERQKALQKAQKEAALQQEAQAKAATEAAAAPMSSVQAAVPFVTPERANELLNQSGVQAMQVSQTQGTRISPQTFGTGTVTNQTAGTSTQVTGMGGIDPEIVTRLSQSLDKFNVDLSANIDRLENMKFQITLDTTNVNVNLGGGEFIKGLKDELQKQLYSDIAREIETYGVQNGKLRKNSGVLGK